MSKETNAQLRAQYNEARTALATQGGTIQTQWAEILSLRDQVKVLTARAAVKMEERPTAAEPAAVSQENAFRNCIEVLAYMLANPRK